MLNQAITIEDMKELSPYLIEKIPYLQMLVLFGSRSTGKTHTSSDWDFAVLYDEEKRQDYMLNPFSWFEVSGTLAQIFKIPDRETNIDVVEINKCSPLLAHFIARDGKLLYEMEAGIFEKFQRKSLLSNSDLTIIDQSNRQEIQLFLQKRKL